MKITIFGDALTALEGPPSPYVMLCLMGGRHEELCLPAA